jgi:TonB family protein
VPYGEVMRIMELLRAAGYDKFRLVYESKPQPSASIVFETAPVPPGLPIPTPHLAPPPAPVAPEVVFWKSSLVARIEQHKQYPKEAASRREQGITQVFFSLDRQGRLLESRVVRPSGSQVLDEEALALLKRARNRIHRRPRCCLAITSNSRCRSASTSSNDRPTSAAH